MLTFGEMSSPVPGWTLESMRNRRALDSQSYWDVQLMRERGGCVVSSQNCSLEIAWDAVKRAAETFDTQHLP